MQIVIDLPDENYQVTLTKIMLACHGCKITELPKGHGELKDTDTLLTMTDSYKSELGRLKADPFVKCGIETVENFIKEMPTIIKSDRSDEE